jgi:hypothetical protein
MATWIWGLRVLLFLGMCCMGVQATYSDDLRWRIVWLRFEDMMTVAAICDLLRMKKSTVYNIIQHFLTHGCVSTRELYGPNFRNLRKTSIDGDNLRYLKRVFDMEPRLYLDEVQDYLEQYSGERFSLRCITGALRRLG